jgi:hypothetical protein
MVRTTYRQHVLNRIDEVTLGVLKHLRRSKLYGVVSSDRAEELLYRCRRLKKGLGKRRYLFDKVTYRKREAKFDRYLDPDHVDGLNDREFKFHFRLTREAFWQLVNLLRRHPNFNREGDARGSVPRPAEEQLLVLLKYFGTEGNGASSFNLGAFFGISTGAVDACRLSALEALLTLEEQTYF